MQNTHNLKSSSLTATSTSPHSYYQHPRHNNHQHQQYNINSSDSDMANAATANPLTNHNHDEYGSSHNLHGLSTASLASAFASLSNNRNNVSGSSFHSFFPSITSNSDGHSNQSDAFSALLLSSLSQMNHPTASPPRANDPLHSQWQPPPRPPPSANPPRAPPSSSKRKAKLADFASLLSLARHVGMSEAVVGATNEELSGFFAVRRPLPSGKSSLLSLRGAAPPPSISCSSLVLRRRSRGNGKGGKKGSGGVRSRGDGAADGERPAVLEMAVPFYTTPDTVSVTPKTILANVVESMEELMESRGKARGAESSGDRPFEMGTVLTRFETIPSSDSSSSSFDGNDHERKQSPGDDDHEEDDDLTSIRLRFRATLDVRICDRVETVEVTAPVTLSGKFESSSSRAAEGEEDHDSDGNHDDDDHLLAAVDLTFDCVRLLESMIGRAGELVDLAVTQAAERAIAPRGPQHQAGAGAVPAVSPLCGTVGDAGSLLAGLALNAAGATETDHAHGRTPSHNSLDSEAAWRTRAEALLGMGSYPSTKTLGTVETLRSNVSGSSSGSGDTRVSGSGHRDDNYGGIFKELGSSSGSLSSDTFQRALAALSRSHDSRGVFGTAGVASGATLASLSSSALAGSGSANGHRRHNNYRSSSSHIINNKNNNLEELAVSDLTKSYLGSLLSLASFGGASSNSNSFKSLKDLEHFSFGSFLPSCSSSLNARARPVGGGGTRTHANNNNNYYNRNPKGENEFLSLSRRLGLKPPSSSANTSRKSNHPSNPTSAATHRRTSLSMMQHDDGSGNANATFDSSLTQLLAAAASNVTGSTGNSGATDSNPIGIKTNNVVRFSDNTNFLKAPSSPTATWSRSSLGGVGLGLTQKYSASNGSANMAPSASNATGLLPQKILMNSLMNHSGSNNPLLQLAQQQQLLRQLKQEAHVKVPGQREQQKQQQKPQSQQQPQSQQIQIQPQQQPQSQLQQQQQQSQQPPVQPKSSNIHQGLFSWLENDSMFLSEEQLKEQDAIDAELERKRREAPMPLRFFTAAEEGDGNLEMVGESLFGNGLGKKGKKNTGVGGNSRKKRKTS